MSSTFPPTSMPDEANWKNYVANELRRGDERMQRVESSIQTVSTKLDKVADSILLLARIEEREKMVQQRLDDGKRDMEDFERRISTMEKDMPGIKETRAWVLRAILAGLGMVLVAVLSMVLKT